MQTLINESRPNETEKLDPHKWVTKHADYLFLYAAKRISDEEIAKDLVQETFLAALERTKKFEGRSSERTWLTAILKNKIIDVYRKKSSGLLRNTNNQITEAEANDFFEEETGHWKEEYQPKAFGLDGYDLLAGKELNGILQSCIKKLPPLWLSVFTMKHIDEEETGFICSELNVTASNFWVIIHRAKVNLRACLQKNWN